MIDVPASGTQPDGPLPMEAPMRKDLEARFCFLPMGKRRRGF